jgi:FkbM family methyltransferase
MYEVDFREDGSLAELFFMQYEKPSLVPILEAVLRPGGTFFDVGANIGIYTGWAARLVGASGQVHAFEPVPRTRGYLTAFLERNGLAQVRVVPAAVGAKPGSLKLHTVPHASGLASALPRPDRGGTVEIEVPVVTLDGYVLERAAAPPALVKIDVEGFEFEVLRGAEGLFRSGNPPVVVFESIDGAGVGGGSTFDDIVRWLKARGLASFALTTSGLRELDESVRAPLSSNTLALRRDLHRAVFDRLEHVRFRRNQMS